MTTKIKPGATYMCTSGSCPGILEKPHHKLDCPDDRVRLTSSAEVDVCRSLGFAYRREAGGILTDAINQLIEARDLWVVQARTEFGLSWTEIGKQLGMTKQSAYERYNPRVRAAAPEVTEPMF